MTQKMKKTMSLILTICMIFSVFAGFAVTASAAGTSVKIVSFLRGEQEDLRSSELLMVQVDGYDGNPLDLTYEWTNGLGTYLYVYNSHNMYGVNNTNGEIEIYNSDKRLYANENAVGRAYNKKYSGTGFAYAAIYGAALTSSSLDGTISVTVKDANGNVIGTDSHTGTITRKKVDKKWTYIYEGFLPPELDADIEGIAFGMFEGNTRNVKDLLGEAGLVHVTCEECSVNEAKVISGGAHIAVSKQGNNYYIQAVSAGDSEQNGDGTVSISVEKGNCKFHQETTAESETIVYVYKKPVAIPGTTTISLAVDSLDPRCTYYIHGVEGVKQSDGSVLFTGLQPNTDYEIEAMGKTTDTDASYAYVYTRTLPIFAATVEVFLNGSYDTGTAVATGIPVDISVVDDVDDVLYLKKGNGEFIAMTHIDTGKYVATVENGDYQIYREANDASQLCDQIVTVDGGNRARYLFYYSVEYDANGGTGAPATTYTHERHQANVATEIPTLAGYDFVGWKDQDGKLYQPGEVITNDIEKAYVLTAQWKKAVRATVNLTVVTDHSSNGGIDPSVSGDLRVQLAYRNPNADEPFVEVVGSSIVDANWYTNGSKNGNVTTNVYPAIYSGLSCDYEYSITAFLSSYEVIDDTVVKTTDAEGNETYDVTVYLKYNPDLFDLAYNIVADASIPNELIPQAVDLKILNWNARIANAWAPISRHVDYSVDERFTSADGRNGQGSYGVPVYNNGATAYYRVDATGLTLADGTEILFTTNDGINYYSLPVAGLAEGAYTAVVTVTGGADVADTDLDGAYGVYITESASGYVQQGVLTVTVYVNRYDVIFESNGGSAVATIQDQFTIPEVSGYVPAKSGYTFAGWYQDAALTTPVVVGATLASDVTLYAKWVENRTVSGTITVAGTYELNGETKVIHEVDRAEHLPVLLQQIDGNGYSHTVATSHIEVTYNNNLGVATYSFADIPNDGSVYRIKVMNTNYGELYQNAKSSSTVVTNYASYTADAYMAEFTGTAAVVNAYLPFEPAIFDLQYEVDATAIGEGFRPTSAGMLISYNQGSTTVNLADWAVISQQVSGSGYIPQDTALVDGLGSNQFPVWASMHDGNTLYDYSIRLADYVMGGTEFTYDAGSVPFMVSYSGIARYSAISGQTATPKATLVPRRYLITFDLNAGDDEIENMEAYEMLTGEYQQSFFWSYGAEINALPIRENYTFLGWYDENGQKVESISPATAQNISLKAQWKKLENYENNYAYIYGYNDTTMGAEGPLLRCETSAMVHRLVKQNGKLGDFVYDASNPSFQYIQGEWFQSGIEFMHHKGGFTVPEGGDVQPYLQITRGEAFKLVCLGLGFSEDTTLSYEDYAIVLQGAGYIVGDQNGDLQLGSFLTRAQFCTMYNRIIGREDALLVDAEGNEITAETYGFVDLDSEAWYYEEMLRATSAYDAEGYVDVALRNIRNELDDYAG